MVQYRLLIIVIVFFIEFSRYYHRANRPTAYKECVPYIWKKCKHPKHPKMPCMYKTKINQKKKKNTPLSPGPPSVLLFVSSSSVFLSFLCFASLSAANSTRAIESLRSVNVQRMQRREEGGRRERQRQRQGSLQKSRSKNIKKKKGGKRKRGMTHHSCSFPGGLCFSYARAFAWSTISSSGLPHDRRTRALRMGTPCSCSRATSASLLAKK